MTRDQLISLFFLALLVFVMYQFFLIFLPFLHTIFWAAILAFAFYPLYERIKPFFKSKHQMIPAVLMAIFIFLAVLPPVIIVVVNVTNQAIELYQSASDYVARGDLEKLIDQIRSLSLIQRIETNVLEWEPLKQNATAWLLGSSKNLANFTMAQAGTLTKNLLIISLNIVLMFFLIFVFLKDGEKIYRFVYQISPLEERNKKFIFNQINDTFSAVIRGQLLTSLTQAIISGVIYWALGLPAPIFFSAATFFATLIPVVGAVSIWMPLALYLVTEQQYVKAVILALLGTMVISLIDNIMKPALIGEKTKLPYFMLFFGILGGIKVYGLMGIFLAPVILSLFFSLVKIFQEKYL